MDRDYADMHAGLALDQRRSTLTPVASLQSIAISAERVNKATSALAGFLDRYHGNPPATASATQPAPPSGYRGDLDRLNDAIARLEGAAAAISEIG